MTFQSIASSAHGWPHAGIAHSHAETFGSRVLSAPSRMIKAAAGHVERRRMLHALGRHDDRVLADMGLDAEAIRREHEGAVGMRRFGPQFPKV